MGLYLNAKKPATLYKAERSRPYFVDKTLLLDELFPLVEAGNQFVCITRPRRFGKTVMANMVASFFGKSECASVFEGLQIQSRAEQCARHENQHNVIYISFYEKPSSCKSYEDYIGRVQRILFEDIRRAYPACRIDQNSEIWDILSLLYEEEEARFIFVFDEWDYIFHQEFVTQGDKREYLSFLGNLLKDKPYVELAYMTGILPIAKYASGSELNMFREYTMSTQHKYSDYFGFTESEVDMLYGRYAQNTAERRVTREGLCEWYDGYHTPKGERLYNPRSVVLALENNQLADYWTSSGPYDEIFTYVKENVADVRDAIAVMMAGEAVETNVKQYAATATELRTRDQIFSAMVVYGFLTCENGRVSIPNRELMDKFADMVLEEQAMGYMYRLAKESERMLMATKAGDTAAMEAILTQAHDTETGMAGYNDETELSAIVRLVYLAAREYYDVQREDKAGVGYVDYIFYPTVDQTADCIILELKIDHTPEEAIEQIKDRKYAQRFIGKLGEQLPYRGRILAVGIAYSKKDRHKKHRCKVEVLRERI